MSKAISGATSGAATGATVGGPWGAAIGGAIGLVGGIAADDADSAAKKEQQDAIARNLALYNGLAVPEQTVDYQNISDGPMLDPRLQAAEQLSQQDALENISLDPRLANAKNNALETLQQIAGKGFTQDEMLAMQAQRGAQEADLTAKLKQIQQGQDMRGLGNSDMAMAQKMMEAQSGANRGAADARSMQAEAMRRSLQAISQGGDMANNFENTEYTRQANLANNQNNREMTNFKERSNITGNNVDRFNEALANNVNRARSVQDSNVGIANKQQDQRNVLGQNKFNNQLTKIQGQSGVNSASGAAASQQLAQSGSDWKNLLSGAAESAAAYNSMNKGKAETTAKNDKAYAQIQNDYDDGMKNYNNSTFGVKGK